MRSGFYLKILEPVMLIAVPGSLFLCSIYEINYTAILTLVIVIVSIIPFFFRFEKQKLKPRDFMHIVVLSALAVVGRIVCAPFYSVQPVTAIIIVCGICYGKQSGFLTGALAALVSNMFFGQGPWTPWQMYTWGLVGYLSGAIEQTGALKKNIVVYICGFVLSMLYGFILDSWYVVAYVTPLNWQTALIGYSSGLVYNIVHAVSTSVFLVAILLPWRKKLERIKQKFGIKNI